MEIIKLTNRKNAYTINRVHNKAWQVVKVLNMYETENEALEGLDELYLKKKTEEEMLEDYIRKGKELEEKVNKQLSSRTNKHKGGLN
jgi:hypothetical protein